MNQNITTGNTFDIEWDSTCLDANAVDIYLYMPDADNSRIHMWQNINFALGKYTSTLYSSWWNSTEGAVKLQVKIVPNGSPPFLLSDFPAAPVFIATKGDKDNGKVTAAIESDTVGEQRSGSSKGKVAAGVLVPLLIIIGASIYAWMRYKRNKGRDDRKRWSEAVDKRMSTISTDWKSISAAGASAAIRNSMAVNGSRNSSFSFGAIRPASTFGENQAGIGIRGSGEDTPQMSQLRPGLRTSAVGVNRVSRVSFAADTRPSGDSRRATRALHTGHVPPVPIPTRQDSSELSPTQTAGPLPLTTDDIRQQMSGQARPSMDDYMPALSSESWFLNAIKSYTDMCPK